MSAAQLERLQEQMQRLRLFKSRERLEALLQDATAKEASYADFLDTLLAEEVASKTAKHVTMRTHLARFPFVKSLDTFDFSYQPSLDKKQIQTLSSCHFIEHGENVVFLGAVFEPDPKLAAHFEAIQQMLLLTEAAVQKRPANQRVEMMMNLRVRLSPHLIAVMEHLKSLDAKIWGFRA